jgi:hypothetical protein
MMKRREFITLIGRVADGSTCSKASGQGDPPLHRPQFLYARVATITGSQQSALGWASTFADRPG